MFKVFSDQYEQINLMHLTWKMRNFRLASYGIYYCVVSFLVLICSRHAQVAGVVTSVGSAYGTAENGLPQVGRTFLLDEIHQTGILFAISAYFVAQTNVSFQIWRPNGDPSTATDQARVFRLIWQTTVTSSVTRFREDIYMEAKFLSTCALVRSGDWLGVVHLTAPAAIGARFGAPNGLMPKMNEDNDGNSQRIGLNATFDMTFNYPYNLLVAGYIFSDPILVNSSGLQKSETTVCPTDLLVPSWMDTNSTTTVPTVTYLPGATGATGATGELGPDGAIGVAGLPGLRGVDGPMGQAGPIGMVGVPGSMGSTGSQGMQGLKGPLGSFGLSGPAGTQGDTGAPGPRGLPGNDTYHYEFLPDLQPVISDLQSDGGFADRVELRMGVIIWLSILSAIVVFSALLLVFVCYFVADDRRVQKNEAAWIEPEK